jgi:hypothetical protein
VTSPLLDFSSLLFACLVGLVVRTHTKVILTSVAVFELQCYSDLFRQNNFTMAKEIIETIPTPTRLTSNMPRFTLITYC